MTEQPIDYLRDMYSCKVRYKVIFKDGLEYFNINSSCFYEITSTDTFSGKPISEASKIVVYLKDRNTPDIILPYLKVLNDIEDSLSYDEKEHTIIINYTSKNMVKFFLTAIRYLWETVGELDEDENITEKNSFLSIVNNSISIFNEYEISGLNTIYLSHCNDHNLNSNHSLVLSRYKGYIVDEIKTKEFLKKDTGLLHIIYRDYCIKSVEKGSLDDIAKILNLKKRNA